MRGDVQCGQCGSGQQSSKELCVEKRRRLPKVATQDKVDVSKLSGNDNAADRIMKTLTLADFGERFSGMNLKVES